MTGLEERLKGVAGVSDIVIELGDEGLRGIRVRMHEGSDESVVLEEIRRVLVAYGLKASSRGGRDTAELESLELDDAGHAGRVDSDTPSDEASTMPQPAILPSGDRLVVRIASPERTVVTSSDSSPLGAAEAIVKAVAEWRGNRPPHRLAVDRLEVDGTDIVVLVARRDTEVASAVAVVSGSLGDALAEASVSLLERLGR